MQHINQNNHPRKVGECPRRLATETTKSVSVVSVGSDSPPWPPRPAELSGWSIDLRQRWGELANELEDQGVMFPESERKASQSREGA